MITQPIHLGVKVLSGSHLPSRWDGASPLAPEASRSGT